MDDEMPQNTLWSIPNTGECPVAETLRTIGGKHKAKILHSLTMSELHFLELARALAGISRKVLVEQLRDLEQSGLVERTQKSDTRRRVSYSLTKKGRSLSNILLQMYEWAVLYKGKD